MNVKKQTIRLEENFNKEIRKQLIEENTNFQQLVTNFLTEWLEEKQKQNK